MRGELTVRVEPKDDRGAEIVLDGSVDAHTFDRFRTIVTDLIDAGTLRLVVDLSKMEYVASVGLNFLVTARADERKKGGDLVLVAPQSHVLTIFRMLGLHEVLAVAATTDEAWATLRAAGP